MTFEILALFVVLAGMAALFLTERLPLELTAFVGLLVLILAGWVPPSRAFEGFSSPPVITMIGTFFVGAGLLHTGIADALAGRVERMAGRSEGRLIFAVGMLGGAFSAFMNNVAATAMLMPAVAALARRTGTSPSKLMLPLASGTILGGTITLIGTPPNMVAADLLREHGDAPFTLFDFAPVGLPLLLLGAATLGLLGKRILPGRVAAAAVSRRSDLLQVYQLHDTLFSIRVSRGSGLAGHSLRDTALARTLGVQVVGVVRGGHRRMAATPDLELEADDVLLVQGSVADVRELFRVRGTELTEARPEELEEASRSVSGVVARLREGSDLAGQTLRTMQCRTRFGLVGIALRRGTALLEEDLGAVPLRAGDELFALGVRGEWDEEALRRHFEVEPMGPEAFRALSGRVYVLRVSDASGLAGATIAESRIGELVGLTISGILRDGGTLLGLDPAERILPGDRLLVTGEPARIRGLLALGGVELMQDVAAGSLEWESEGIVEVTLAPRSSVAGKTLAEIDFRERYGLTVLAVWRAGTLLHEHLAGFRLAFGDALLLHGPWARIRQIARDSDFLALAAPAREERRTGKIGWVVAALVLMIGMVATGWQPAHVAAFAAGTLVVLSGAITMPEAYRALEWRVVFLVAAILPIGTALENTGAAPLLARQAHALLGPLGPETTLVVLAVLASVLSQLFDGAPAVVMLAPVAFAVSDGLGISPRPLMMAVGLAASATYLAPFSHKANLLVMGAGGYRASDYFRAGVPLTLIHLGLIATLVPLLFPF